MSKPFSNTSLGRDLQPKHDPSRMGLGQMGQGSGRVASLMGMDLTSKMGQQRSHGMMSSGGSQSLSSAFGLGNRGQASSQSAREPDPASKILASFGLSSSDLDELSRFPEDKITAENLPEIIQHLKRRRAEQSGLNNRDRLSRDSMGSSSGNWDDLRSLRTNFDRPSGLNPMGDFGQGGGSRDASFRERLNADESLRERLRGNPFLSDSSFRQSEGDYNRFGSVQERSRGTPSSRNIDDFHGLPPKTFPHLCSLCDYPVNSFQSWDEHVSGRLHKKQCLLLCELFPQWKGHGMVTDPLLLQRSTNPAPGIMGPPPQPMSMGVPNALGNIGGRPGMQNMAGKRQMPTKRAGGRVVHIVDIQRTKTLKPQLMKLVEPFGTVTNSLILNSTKEAFIEMATPEQARAVISYYEMNPAYVYGKPVRVLLSLKYKEIKTKDDTDGRLQQNAQSNRQSPKPQSKQGTQPPVGLGRVLRLCNLPKSDYSDNSVVQLAKKYGKVVNYILMRKMRQAFVEMERAEDAQAMINQCAKVPLMFKGGAVQVLLSQKYSCLVLKIPNNAQQKKSRKRTRSSDGTEFNKKQRNEKDDMVTTEEDLVTGSSDPELEDDDDDEEQEEDSANVSHLQASDSDEDDDDAEVPDISDLDQRAPLSSTPFPAGDEKTEDKTSEKRENEQPGDMDVDKPTVSQTAPASAPTQQTVADLGPYQPNVPTGVNYVIEKTGYYCKLCALFYTNEDMAKVTHCSSLAHYKKVKKMLSRPNPDSSLVTKTEQ